MSAYQVLARKWRPKTFADLVGQQHVVKALQNALDKGRLHHAYLLTGTRGVGKTTIARILAKSLNCEAPVHGEPCGRCQSCRDIDAGRFVDLLEIDAASNTGIDNIREVLENAQYAPTAGKYKVYIIDEVHMLSKSAFNAMLKTLEEPPEHVKFILATTDPHKVPVTVLSRCLQFVLRNMTAQQVSDHLAHVLNSEGIAYEAPALALLGRAAAGSMRDALSLLDQAIAMGSGSVNEADVRQMIGAVDKRYLYELLEYLMQQDGVGMIAKAQEMAANAVGFDSALSELATLLQRLALFKTVPAAIAADDPEHERLLHLSHYFGDEQIQLYYQCLIHGRQDLSLAPDEYAGFVMTLLRMLAFAPFAAKHTPENAVIEGTQLHTPEPAAPKPALPESSAAAPNSGSLKQSRADINAREPLAAEQAENRSAVPQQSAVAETGKVASFASGSLNHSAAAPDDEGDTPPWPIEGHSAVSAVEEAPPADTAAVDLGSLNELADLAEAVAASHSDSPNLTAVAITEQPREPVQQPQVDDSGSLNRMAEYESAETAWDNGAIPPEFIPFDELPPAYGDHGGYAGIPSETAAAVEEATVDHDAPMPELTAANWPLITQRIGHQVSAAQMPLSHMAWVDFADGVLHLALEQEQTRNNLKKEYFDRIAAALSSAYGMPVRIQTQPFVAGQGWETPDMYRKRQVQEMRALAKNYMEQDVAMQQIQTLFQTSWREESLYLLPETAQEDT